MSDPETPREMFCPEGPALIYVVQRDLPEIHVVDGENWTPDRLATRDRAILRALLRYALDKIKETR